MAKYKSVLTDLLVIMTHELIWVDPAQLQPNPWNSNIVSPENEAKLKASIERRGMFKPIVVRQLDNGTLQIIGGEHRALVAKQMKVDKVPAFNLGKISDVEAKEIGLLDNGRYGSDDALKLAEIFADIGTPEDLATFMPFTSSDIDTIFSNSTIALDALANLNLPEEDIELPSGKAVQTHQIMRFKVPVEQVDKVVDRIQAVIKSQGYDDDDPMINAGDALAHIVLK
ncbi:ParB/RepB/Spo0J family partition protein [Acinetobacter baumannii]|uniref:ParB/RepB/Spo0J family partition protein n=1 Tax=Acinetobacter baumannii TaxID=470 RepID=UPI0013D7637B|nr:ParB/RepB/Spo0J family partition protein [Acinetobacter baumannii]HCW3853234.1 ParB/RepB/Spo0J family partition protein [Acinetobacter baumannii]HCW5100420.1 ParB/RepB/Spo0J family partition protein [Acinetobacter baumannii]